jgi:hypothetical protein
MLATIVAAVAFQSPVGLQLKAVAGQTLTLAYSSEAAGGESRSVFTGEYTFKVLGVSPKAIRLERTLSNKRYEVNGVDETDDEGRGDPDVVVFFLSPLGKVEYEVETRMWSTDRRQDLALMPVLPDKPVSVGSKWTVKYPAHDDVPASEVTFIYRGTEKVEGQTVSKLEAVFKETGTERPLSSEGFFWLSPVDGWPIKAALKMKNVGWDDADTDTLVTLVRKEKPGR